MIIYHNNTHQQNYCCAPYQPNFTSYFQFFKTIIRIWMIKEEVPEYLNSLL